MEGGVLKKNTHTHNFLAFMQNAVHKTLADFPQQEHKRQSEFIEKWMKMSTILEEKAVHTRYSVQGR